jgi:hypothetical protein
LAIGSSAVVNVRNAVLSAIRQDEKVSIRPNIHVEILCDCDEDKFNHYCPDVLK